MVHLLMRWRRFLPLALAIALPSGCGDDDGGGAALDASPSSDGGVAADTGTGVIDGGGDGGASVADAGSTLDGAAHDASADDDGGASDGGGPTAFLPLVAAGWHHACASRPDGSVVCWGNNESGQLGDGTTVDRTTPVAVTGLADVVELEAGGFHTCARTSAGEVYCWGEGSRGQLGDRHTLDRTTPASMHRARRLGVAQISAGGGDYPLPMSYDRTGVTCVRTSGGEAHCTGANDMGQLGNGRGSDESSLVGVGAVTGTVAQLAAGTAHVCALMADRTVWCWGDTSYGQNLRITTADGEAWMVPDLTDAVLVAATGANTCVAQTGGVARCWGGEIRSDPSRMIVESSPAPFSVPSIDGLGVGAAHACALLGTGEVRCWGDNERGQLGEDPEVTSFREEPGSTVLSSAVSIVGGLAFNVAVLSDGSVVTWGENTYGQLGDGTTTDGWAPSAVSF